MNERGFTKKDETLVRLLMRTDMPKNVAKTLVFLRKKEETTSVEIEISTALRQPEVSIAMQELRRRKWVVKALPFEKIIETIEKDERKRIEEIENNIKALKQAAQQS